MAPRPLDHRPSGWARVGLSWSFPESVHSTQTSTPTVTTSPCVHSEFIFTIRPGTTPYLFSTRLFPLFCQYPVHPVSHILLAIRLHSYHRNMRLELRTPRLHHHAHLHRRYRKTFKGYCARFDYDTTLMPYALRSIAQHLTVNSNAAKSEENW